MDKKSFSVGGRLNNRVRLLAPLLVSLAALSCVSTNKQAVEESHKKFDYRANFQSAIVDAFRDTPYAGVKVRFDDSGVPHILGPSDEAAFAAQGYTQAYFRLWQMEVSSRVIEGTVGQLTGNRLLPDDVLAQKGRLLETAQAAERVSLSDPKTKEALEGFAAGVNARIKQFDNEQLPPEFLLAGKRPRPWRPVDSVMISIYSSWIRATALDELKMKNSETKLGKDLFREFFPDVGFGRNRPSRNQPPHESTSVGSPVYGLVNLKQHHETGSNSWIIPSSLSATGHPIVANDYHSEYLLPSYVMPIQLISPGFNVIGATAVGVPGVLSGTNGKVAWAIVNAMADTTDWYSLRFKEELKTKYRWNGNWLPVEESERRTTMGDGHVETIRIRNTKAGPLIPRAGLNAGEIAARWTEQDAVNHIGASLRLMSVGFAADCGREDLLRDLPAYVYSCVDQDGKAGFWMAGRVPRRPKHLDPRMTNLATGTKDTWDGYLRSEKGVREFPIRSPVILANQALSGAKAYYGWNFSPTYRARRLENVISRNANWTIESTIALQSDVINLAAIESKSWLLKDIGLSLSHRPSQVACLRPTMESLDVWDGSYDANSKVAPVFSRGIGAFYQAALTKRIGPIDDHGWPTMEQFLALAEREPEKIFLGSRLSAQLKRAELVRTSFESACRDLEPGLKWGKAIDTRFRHLGQVGKPEVHMDDVPGCGVCVLANRGNHGPVWRSVVSLEQKPRFFFIVAGELGSQSESPAAISWFYNWRRGHLLESPFLAASDF